MFNLKNHKNQILPFVFSNTSKIKFKLLTTVICFVFIGNSIYYNFEELSNQTVTLRVLIWLSNGIIFSLLSIFINAFAWKLLINNIGCNSDDLNIIRLFLNTNIYKYLPGGVWHFIARYNKLRLNFSIEKSVESILLEPFLMLVAGLIFIPFGNLSISVCVFCWGSTLVFMPRFRRFMINKLKIMKNNIFTYNDKINDKNLVQNNRTIASKVIYPYKPLFIEIIFIQFRFIGFLCCMKAFSIGASISQAELMSSFSLAWIAGLIVPAAPGGLGVFESVILFGLGSQLPEAPLLASLLSYRLVATVSDIFAALVYPVKRLLNI
tara:strand:- start:466 stop:1431 length:966 start_codon:yes stop_codon:yes gene_type:complete